MQIAMLGVLLGLLILYFVFYYFKNKKDRENYKNTIQNLKNGNRVLTSAGIVGKVVSIQEEDDIKTITLETGNGKNKGYITFDIQAVYMVLDKEKNTTLGNVHEVIEEPVMTKQELSENINTENINKEDFKEEKTQEVKKSTSKNSTSKKSKNN